MKKILIRFSLCLLVMAAVFGGAVRWRHEYYSGNAIETLLIWPATVLALQGLAPSWPAALIALLVLPAAVIFCLRSKPVIYVVVSAALAAFFFCYAGVWQSRSLAATMPPTSPYPMGSSNAVAYAEGYGEGYAVGVSGSMTTWCFGPVDSTRGLEDGQVAGRVIFRRVYNLPADKHRFPASR